MNELKIKSIKYTGVKKSVYDLNVLQNHNFFVGKSQVLTSNCDRISVEGLCLLRNLMETYSQHTRFILTANYHEKIIDPIKSRCQSFEVKPLDKASIMRHIVKILQSEKIKFKNEDVAFIVNSYAPDLRKIINFTQQSSIDGELKLLKANVADHDYRIKLINLLKAPDEWKTFGLIRQLVADASFSNYEEIYKYLFANVDSYSGDKAASVILILADAVYQNSLVFEREITFVATMHRILTTLKK